jgi:hypothetical protein
MKRSQNLENNSMLKPLNPLVMAAGMILTASSLLACGTESQQLNSAFQTVAFSRWNHSNIRTCWEFESAYSHRFRERIEQTTSKAFANTTVSFVGWKKCKHDGYEDVKLFIYDDIGSFLVDNFRSFLKTLMQENGDKRDGAGHPRLRDENKPARVVLNQTFKDAEKEFVSLYRSLTSEGKSNLALTASIHELGHALGLRHEDAHPNRTCDTFSEDLSGDRVITDYNPFSFMSRCYYRTFNHNLSLILPNQRDAEGINKLYEGVLPLGNSL